MSSKTLRFATRLIVPSFVVAALALAPHPVTAAPASEGESASTSRVQDPSGFRFSAPRTAIGLRLGYTLNSADSEVFDFITDQLTVEPSDFNAFTFAFDFSWLLSERIDLVAGLEYSRASKRSEFRDYVDQDGIPIVQDNSLTQVPLTLSLRFYLTSRGRQVGQYAWVPSDVAVYVGGGGGGTWYQLEQVGEFVDFRDLVIFEDQFVSDGWALSAHVLAGADIRLSNSIGLVLEGRYQFASTDLTGSFVGFDPIDLDGLRLMAGVSFKL